MAYDPKLLTFARPAAVAQLTELVEAAARVRPDTVPALRTWLLQILVDEGVDVTHPLPRGRRDPARGRPLDEYEADLVAVGPEPSRLRSFFLNRQQFMRLALKPRRAINKALVLGLLQVLTG